MGCIVCNAAQPIVNIKRWEEQVMCIVYSTGTGVSSNKVPTAGLKESLFRLRMPLEHIDFHIIGYWTPSKWSL